MISAYRSIPKLSFVIALALGTFHFAYAGNGGIVGGGGNVIVHTSPKQKLSVEKTHLVIAAALQATKYTLFDFESKHSQGHEVDTLWARLFSQTPSIYSILHFERVEIRDHASCEDADGVSYDGSTLSAYPGTICVSASRLAYKVDESEMKIQAIALIVHEISETMGFTDDEAIHLQRDILAQYER